MEAEQNKLNAEINKLIDERNKLIYERDQAYNLITILLSIPAIEMMQSCKRRFALTKTS